MPIQYRCLACEQLLSIARRMAGQVVICPTCGAATVVPQEEAEDAGAPREEWAADDAVAADGGDVAAPAGGIRVRPREYDNEEMDLTPMVDMTFLLLIFFMITASFSLQKTIEVPAPSPDQKGASQALQTLDEMEQNSVIVRIDGQNVIHVDDELVTDRARLAQVLRGSMRATARTELVLTADDSAFHETVIAVIDAANEVGMQKIRMASRAER